MPVQFCALSIPGEWIALSWALVSIGYAVGLALRFLPLPGGSGSWWGGYLMSYAIASSAFLAVIAAGNTLQDLVTQVQGYIGKPEGFTPCENLVDLYYNLGNLAFTALATMSGIGIGTALIPIVGPALANILSVVSTFPGMVLSSVMIIAYTLAAFLTVFGTLAPILAPAGVAMIVFPAGKLKGIGAWMLAAALVFSIAAPFIPAVGVMACEMGGKVDCKLDEFQSNDIIKGMGEGAMSLVEWIFNKDNAWLMKAWRFALGSLAGWSLLTLGVTGLSMGMGKLAASIGFG